MVSGVARGKRLPGAGRLPALRAIALVGVLAVIASSCTQESEERPAQKPAQGGAATFGAGRWPQCLNPVTSCNLSAGYHVTVAQLVFPKLMMLDRNNEYVASPLLTEAPSVTNGLVTTDPFTVTYRLNPKAVWDDGTPITSRDVKFTWLAINNTTGSDNLVGYDKIAKIDTPEPSRAVLRFKEPYAAWPELFGGGNVNGYVLKRTAFPKASKKSPDLENELEDAIPFSGGPWKLRSWDDSQAVLVRNPRYWGTKTLLDEITFVPFQEAPEALAALTSGDVSAIFLPEGPGSSVAAQLERSPDVDYATGPTNFGQALWLNLRKAPLNDRRVREALAYGVDRQSVINRVIKLNDPNARVLQCLPPLLEIMGRWCHSSFAKFRYDPQRSIRILESAGWNCSKRPCTKDGAKLSIVDSIPAGDQRGAAAGRVIKERAIPAGFQISVKETDATDLFVNKMPRGEYQMADLSLGGVADPGQSITATYHCDAIPRQANDFSGVNTSFWCNQEASKLMEDADKEVSETKRIRIVRRIQELLGEDVVAIPLYSVTAITAWRSDRIAGPVGTWTSAFYGPYFNAEEWFRPGGRSTQAAP